MRKIALALAAASALLSAPALQARDKLTPEQQLAKLLEGRVAGKPVSCINTMTSHESQIFDKTAVVFGSGSVIYVNRPAYPETLNSDDIMVTVLHGNQLCKMDIVRMRDRNGMGFRGTLSLQDFVPYRKVAPPKH